MTLASRLTSLIMPTLLILASPARADEVQIGTSLVCDTQRQVERFVVLYDGDALAAVSAVNAEEHDDNACGMITMAFVPGPALTTARAKDATFQIIPIVVLGVVTSDGIQPVEPAHLFSLLPVDELEA
jgi:hypothetical protein